MTDNISEDKELREILEEYRFGNFFPRPFEPDQHKWAEKYRANVEAELLKSVNKIETIINHKLSEARIGELHKVEYRFDNGLDAKNYVSHRINQLKEKSK